MGLMPEPAPQEEHNVSSYTMYRIARHAIARTMQQKQGEDDEAGGA
jgi:hypothetical protein